MVLLIITQRILLSENEEVQYQVEHKVKFI